MIKLSPDKSPEPLLEKKKGAGVSPTFETEFSDSASKNGTHFWKLGA